MEQDKPCNLIRRFSPDFIKMIDDTKVDGKERSVNFCPSNGDIKLSNVCIGNECSIPRTTEVAIACKDNKTAIGNLHTHPGIGVQHGEISDNDVLHSLAKGKKFACIGYRGIAKSIDCYRYPYGIPKEEADKFKSMNLAARERKLLEDLQKYSINIIKGSFGGSYIKKAETSSEQWKKIQEDANSFMDLKNKFKKYISTNEARENRLKNSCTIFLAPLDD